MPLEPEVRARLAEICALKPGTDLSQVTDAALSQGAIASLNEIEAKCKVIIDQRDAALSQAAAAEARAVDLAASQSAPRKPEPWVLSMAEGSLSVAKENAVRSGRLHAATAETLYGMLHTDKAPNDVAMSMDAGEQLPFGVRLFNVLAGMPPIPPMGKSEVQVLPNVASSQPETGGAMSEDRRKQLLEMAKV